MQKNNKFQQSKTDLMTNHFNNFNSPITFETLKTTCFT